MKSLTLNENNYSANIHLANLLMELGQGQRAAKYYHQALRLKPNSIAATNGLMLSVFLYANDTEVCIHHLEDLLRHDPDNFIVLTQLAILRFLQYEDVTVVALLRKALAINNSYEPALHTMGELLRFSMLPETAVKFYEKVLN